MAGPRSVTYSEADLQRMLDQRFPMERRLVDLLDVRVSQPRLTLLPGKDRLAMELKVDASDRLFGSGVHGHVALESGLRLDAADGSIRLVGVKVTSVAIDNPGGKPPIMPVERIGALLGERMLEGAALHQLRPDQLEKLTRAGYKPGAIAVTPAGITITVVPG